MCQQEGFTGKFYFKIKTFFQYDSAFLVDERKFFY